MTAFAGDGGNDVHTLCIAGVGSSALGSAAFARNVADATGRTAAAVVSGFGTADLLTEALGGWFLFASVNRLRHHFELWESLLPKSFKLLVGHSKGNLVLAEALNGLVYPKRARESIAKIKRIVTISAAIYMPDDLGHAEIVDVMGEWDVLGPLNSSPLVHIDRPIPHAGHHTNTKIAGHLPVRSVIKTLMDESRFAEAIAG